LTAKVTVPDVPPPVNPVLAVTPVIVPEFEESAAGAHFVPSYFKTCPVVGAVVSTLTPLILSTEVVLCVPLTSPLNTPVNPAAFPDILPLIFAADIVPEICDSVIEIV
jgi:hypothetical protein